MFCCSSSSSFWTTAYALGNTLCDEYVNFSQIYTLMTTLVESLEDSVITDAELRKLVRILFNMVDTIIKRIKDYFIRSVFMWDLDVGRIYELLKDIQGDLDVLPEELYNIRIPITITAVASRLPLVDALRRGCDNYKLEMLYNEFVRDNVITPVEENKLIDALTHCVWNYTTCYKSILIISKMVKCPTNTMQSYMTTSLNSLKKLYETKLNNETVDEQTLKEELKGSRIEY